MTLGPAELSQPAWLLAVPLWWMVSRRRRPVATVPTFDTLLELRPLVRRSWRVRLAWLPALLGTLRTLLVVLALCGLRTADPTTASRPASLAVVFVIDQSGSMAETDGAGRDRLRRLQDTLAGLSDDRLSDGRLALGLVSFAAEAQVRCPPTTRLRWWRGAVASLEVKRRENLTNVGDGLLRALGLLQGGGVPGAVVLCSDGAHNAPEGTPAAVAARVAEALGFPVHTVLLDGSADAEARATLAGIARITGGRFLPNAADLPTLLASFDVGPPRPVTYARWTDRTAVFVVAALVLWALRVLLGRAGLQVRPVTSL